MRRASILALLAAASACHAPPPVGVEPVRLYVAPGLPAELAVEGAQGFAVAAPRLVKAIDEAEVAWLPDPLAALALGDRAPPGSAPEQPGVPDAFLDPKRRFAPVGAVARVIVAAPAPRAGFAPDDLSELADPRVRGQVALARLGRGDGPTVVAALDLAYGERGTHGWLRQLAANAPQLVETDAEAVERVATGAARYALAGSLVAGAEAAKGRVRIVFTDQNASGSLVIPTALVVLPGAGAGARKLSAWLAGPTAERFLAGRAVGLIPLRPETPAPPGIVPVSDLRLLTIRWSDLAERRPVWARELADWGTHPGRNP